MSVIIKNRFNRHINGTVFICLIIYDISDSDFTNVRFRSIGLQTPEFIRTSYGYVTGSDFSRQTAISCCPVNSGLTYRLPSAKFVHSGNFGGCGLVPLLLLQEAWACLLPVRTGGTPEFESG